jgi:DNA-binding transcriptional MocR family regulator
MVGSVAAPRLAGLVGAFDRRPAYLGLADELRLLVGDGRLGTDLRLPSERDLSVALGVSRTTVTRAYAVLVEAGYAVARRGSGTYTRLPGGRRQMLDRTLTPHADGDADLLDLSCAAGSAPPGVAAAYAEAVADLPAYLGGHGYFPTGLPALQEAVAATYDARGLPTDPAQVMVVPGALSALMVVAQSLVTARDRVVVESPGYPNAHAALRRAGARPVALPMDVDGWDLDAVARIVRQAEPTLAYLIPDFQNPTGNLMTDAEREEYAALLRRTGTVAVVDESHVALRLDGDAMPRPFASYAPDAITLGSASKSLWGGLRIGWVRCPLPLVERLVEARVALDLGSPVLEQLVAARLLAQAESHWQPHRERLRTQRDALAAALADRVPDWTFRLPPGGLSLWCELPARERRAGAVALTAEAEARGVAVSPGPVFALDGGLDAFVRIPYTRSAHDLRGAVDRLADAWAAVTTRADGRPDRPARVMVA